MYAVLIEYLSASSKASSKLNFKDYLTKVAYGGWVNASTRGCVKGRKCQM